MPRRFCTPRHEYSTSEENLLSGSILSGVDHSLPDYMGCEFKYVAGGYVDFPFILGDYQDRLIQIIGKMKGRTALSF